MSDKSVLAGELSFVGLADCFQILGGNNSTGSLHFANPYTPTPGVIYFVDGNPINASTGSSHGLDAIYSLFGWTEGSFQFLEENVSVDHVVSNSRMEIVLDAMRMLDDGLIKKVGSAFSEQVPNEESQQASRAKDGGVPVIKGAFVDYMYVVDEDEFRDGTKLVTEGGHGNWIWVILEGTVKVTRETSNGAMELARLGEGCFIGTVISFLEREYARNATVTAVGNIQVGVLDTQRLYQEYISFSNGLRALIPSLDGRLKKITDRAAELFEGKSDTVKLPDDKKLVLKQGTSKEEAYSITQGKAHVVRRTRNGYLPLMSLEQGDTFGNIPFINMGHEPHHASIIASEDLKVNKLDVKTLQQDYKQLSGIFRNLIESVCTCVSVTTRLACKL
ncbi:MAG: hypothetical protein BBJ60_06040 [Desulfobacterales bacterium S7086C20]|nr:MAG: hypothetical protein BBJ60_06040 [Desulfobacterales bacterium S7086C20]